MDADLRKIALLIEYDGRAYHGFQVQANACTIQGILEKALHTITGENNRLKGGSRTDAGVHALGQVATFTTCRPLAPETFVAALNYYLPEDVAVLEAAEVALEFDPRRHALRRCYRYCILNRRSPSPLARGSCLWVREELDVEAMDCGARELVGQRDFASFSGPLTNQRSTIRRMCRSQVTREGSFVFLDMEANAFLPQQVRRTMGVLLAVGKGQQRAELIRSLRDHPSLGAARTAAPPHGLWLSGIAYPEDAVAFNASPEALPAFPRCTTRVKETFREDL